MNEWISCSERMPNHNDCVLTYYPDMQFDGWSILAGQCIAFYDASLLYPWRHTLHYDVVITHWMPLPEPPKEEV